VDLLQHYRQLHSYDVWANREVLGVLVNAKPAPARSVGLLAHICAAEQLWLERIQGVPQSTPVWPGVTLEQCGDLISGLARSWGDFLRDITDASLDGLVRYKNLKGEEFNSRVGDILTHVFTHSAYHRGQIAADMRAAGFAPAYTDFIHGVRQGLVE
jgi:uncharacterized damage-inducible protein DinB